ncbi:MAG: riboflavin kinase, partial [Elioraea tepidiphila]
LLDFQQEIYGQTLEVEFIRRLRGEQRFESVEALIAQIQARAFETVPFVPLGQFQQPTAFRRTVQGIAKAPVPFFWGVSKS